MYQDLLEMERKLDWTMMRKRVEVQDALGRIPSVCFLLCYRPLYFLLSYMLLPCFPRRRVLWEYSWVIQYLVNSGKMRERFHLRQISKPVRESLLGRSKSREGYWRSVFEDSHVAPCLTFLHDKQQVPNQRHRDKAPLRKFSTMIKRMVVELDRDPALYSDGNIVEVSVLFFFAIQLLTNSVSTPK